MNTALCLLCKLVEVDALTPSAKGRGQDTNVFLLSCSQRFHFIELDWQLSEIYGSKFANFYSVRVLSTPFFHHIIRIYIEQSLELSENSIIYLTDFLIVL